MKKTAYILIVLIIILVGGYSYIQLAFPKVGPAPEMLIEITPERIERGEYLAYNVMLCMDCHAVRDWSVYGGPPTPGTEGAGGDRFDQSMGFPGEFYSRNITPAGIGDWTDGEIYRLLTTGVKKDGDPIFPVMPYLNYGKMDPEDIKSVIAFLRTMEPIQASHPESKPDFPFNLILRTLPQEATPMPIPPKEDQIAYGEYLLNAAACADCHTNFEKGKYVGDFLAGGRVFQSPDGSILRSSNLTPHETGLKNWTSKMFVERFKIFVDSTYIPQAVKPGEFQTIMPWAMYAGMKTEDLEAIFAYIQTIEPSDNFVEKYIPASGK
ncbi:MAG: cytochrome C [Bacteroidetes bacterium]|nr:cytochrome C [Bacteroidota bacterium]